MQVRWEYSGNPMFLQIGQPFRVTFYDRNNDKVAFIVGSILDDLFAVGGSRDRDGDNMNTVTYTQAWDDSFINDLGIDWSCYVESVS